MRTPERWSVAIRRGDGEIAVESHAVQERWATLRETFARGLGALAEAMSIGLEALRISVRETSGVMPTAGQMRSTMAAVVAGMLALFVVAPALFVAALPDPTADAAEAALRAAVLLVYLFVVSRSEAAKRLFVYHGAEHKVIAAFEQHGTLPTIDQARSASPIHFRCGTSFIVLFVLVGGVVHAFVPRTPVVAGIGWRLALAPVDAMLAYEIMRATARNERSMVARVISAPGRLLQRWTTREPADDELRVAIAAFGALWA
ncbi:MAG TPA: DUF1385 domain-containing protein [Actinomycetota bacterium]|jgi:uncharacterized protein YqhQ|nr:DUF1385 domain-containing protein [Actinomycetota bacterium]